MQVDPIETYELPQSVLLRVSKSVIPQGTQINGEAKTALSRSTLVFVNYLTTAYRDN
jgi:DNA polymerase epsilon subunit 3